MSKPGPADPVRLLASVLASEAVMMNRALMSLSALCGSFDFISALMPFDYTDYYTTEMGSPLLRRFVFFETLIGPETLPDVKIVTNSIEESLTGRNGRRQVNIDPGYIALAHLILATGKGYTHRPYLRDGIYADLTLIFRDRSFHPLPWTYPDYLDEKMIELFNRIREKYVIQLKMGQPSVSESCNTCRIEIPPAGLENGVKL
jgi:hypothetical protein